MFAIIHLLATFIADLFKPPHRLEVENLFLRHQLNIALRRAPQRVRVRPGDRALMVWMTRRWPGLLCVPKTSSLLIRRANRLTSVHSDDLVEEAKQEGIAFATLRRAKKDLG